MGWMSHGYGWSLSVPGIKNKQIGQLTPDDVISYPPLSGYVSPSIRYSVCRYGQGVKRRCKAQLHAKGLLILRIQGTSRCIRARAHFPWSFGRHVHNRRFRSVRIKCDPLTCIVVSYYSRFMGVIMTPGKRSGISNRPC